tara:strand:+ start:2316 stop:3206 length:891 start_codon:yes stop_codon:yes gene_type:complete
MSWNGTVRCGYCGRTGHNKTGCETLKQEWVEDPTSYAGRKWARIQAAKNAPKLCGYCNALGHTRAGCVTMKEHKATFAKDRVLWILALAKWCSEVGLGVGSLVRGPKLTYYVPDSGAGTRSYRYNVPVHHGDEGYQAPCGIVFRVASEDELCHLQGIARSSEWYHQNIFLKFDRVGDTRKLSSRTPSTLTIPSIPGIVPSQRSESRHQCSRTRDDRGNTTMEVLTPSSTSFNLELLTLPKQVKAYVKSQFSAKNEQRYASNFHSFGDLRRSDLQKYVNGEIELSDLLEEYPLAASN